METTGSLVIDGCSEPRGLGNLPGVTYDDVAQLDPRKAVLRLRDLRALPREGNDEEMVVRPIRQWHNIRKVKDTVSTIAYLGLKKAATLGELENQRLQRQLESYKIILVNTRKSYDSAVKVLVQAVAMYEAVDDDYIVEKYTRQIDELVEKHTKVFIHYAKLPCFTRLIHDCDCNCKHFQPPRLTYLVCPVAGYRREAKRTR